MKYLVIVLVLIGGFFMFMHNTNAKDLVTYAELQQKISSKADIVLLDVRTLEEYNSGHIPTSVLLPHNEIEAKAEQLLTDKNKEIIVYCRSGNRSNQAQNMLIKLGYTNVRDFGGISRWEGNLEK